MKRYLVLEDGTVYEGEGFGADVEAIGELVFNTGVVGYLDTLTDPCYFGQIVMQTFPSIGNYGIIESELQGKCHLKGYVMREWCEAPSNFRSEYDLDRYLKAQGVPGLYGVDTRAITQHLRDHGVMNAMLCAAVPESLEAIRAYAVKGAVQSVAVLGNGAYPATGDGRHRVTVINYGAPGSLVAELRQRGCDVQVVPYDTPAQAILEAHPEGVALSEGPGNPAELESCVQVIRALMGKVPLFGVGLGHQLLSLAAGGRTYKLPYGHRGGNQPCRDMTTGRTYITAQNHGYAVDMAGITKGREYFVNANDLTCAGIDYPSLRACSVQFRPHTDGGPMDTGFVVERFLGMLGDKS